jgi:hypothetical protein
MQYTLSRALTKSERASLEAARTGLSKALADVARASKAAGDGEKKLNEMEAREGKLEKEADRGSEDASLKLAALRDQIARTRASIANSRTCAVEGRALNGEVLRCSDLLPPIVQRDLQTQIEDLIEARNGDFFFDRTHARGVAFGCDALAVLRNAFAVAPQTTIAGRVSEGEHLHHVVDQLLKGGPIFEFPLPTSKRASTSKSRR